MFLAVFSIAREQRSETFQRMLLSPKKENFQIQKQRLMETENREHQRSADTNQNTPNANSMQPRARTHVNLTSSAPNFSFGFGAVPKVG
jgi:hypothetical protein